MTDPRFGAATPGPTATLDWRTGLLDALLWLLAIVIAGVVVTGGGQLDIGGQTARLRTVGNPLLFAAVLGAVRLRWPHVPVLGLRGRTPADLAGDVHARAARLYATLSTIDRATAVRWLAGLVLIATLIRIANVLAYFGFITGDDVEIHEMSIGSALNRGWPVWDLRNPFYPMTFIYPAQRLLVALGVTDVFTLVAAGRLVVTAIAALNIVLVYRVGVALFTGRGPALLAAGLFFFNHLHMAFGSAELPRVVATAFILGAFQASLRATTSGAAVAGMLLGVGAAMRFGEAVFVAPAAMAVMSGWSARGLEPLRARLARAAVLAVAFGATALLVLGIADALYWGEAFHSLRAIVDYTLVRRLSSRGYEPPWHYLTQMTDWSNVLLVVLAAAAVRGPGRLALLWAAVPVALLSALPHKEARYVIATVPFWALAAGSTLWAALAGFASAPRRQSMRALVLVAAIIGACVFDASKFRFRRSEQDVRLAWAISGRGGRGIAADQLWRMGGRLYLDPSWQVVELDPDRPDDAAVVREALCRPDITWAVLRRDSLGAERLEALSVCGFPPDPAASSPGLLAFRKR